LIFEDFIFVRKNNFIFKFSIKGNDYMGRFYAKPTINETGRENPTRPNRYNLYLNYSYAGDISASFELIYLKVIAHFTKKF
jgi:hypothetical protein